MDYYLKTPQILPKVKNLEIAPKPYRPKSGAQWSYPSLGRCMLVVLCSSIICRPRHFFSDRQGPVVEWSESYGSAKQSIFLTQQVVAALLHGLALVAPSSAAMALPRGQPPTDFFPNFPKVSNFLKNSFFNFRFLQKVFYNKIAKKLNHFGLWENFKKTSTQKIMGKQFRSKRLKFWGIKILSKVRLKPQRVFQHKIVKITEQVNNHILHNITSSYFLP